MRLSFVGGDLEHSNRRGTTRGQFLKLVAGTPMCIIPADALKSTQVFILEDLDRQLGGTVIGGGVMALAAREDTGRTALHLKTCVIRPEAQRKHLASYVVGKMLKDALLSSEPTELYVYTGEQTETGVKDTLVAKGFRCHADSSFSLQLPGADLRWRGNDEASHQTITQARWSGLYGDRVYRDGLIVGSMQRGDMCTDDPNPDDPLVIYDAQQQEVGRWETEDPDIDWHLTAALFLLNRPDSSSAVC